MVKNFLIVDDDQNHGKMFGEAIGEIDEQIICQLSYNYVLYSNSF